MDPKYVKTKEFDTENLTLLEVKLNPNKKGSTGYIRYNDAGSEYVVNIQSNVYLRKPFKLSKFLKDGMNESDPNAFKYSMTLNLKDDPDFIKALSEIDNWAIKLGVANSKKWFGKKMKEEQVEFMYSKSLKEPLNKEKESLLEKYGYQMSVKLPTKKTGEFSVAVYNNKKERIPEDEIEETLNQPGLSMKAMIEVTSLWIAGSKSFGITYRVTQLRLKKVVSTQAYAFSDSSGDEDEGEDHDEDEKGDMDDVDGDKKESGDGDAKKDKEDSDDKSDDFSD